MLIDRFLPEYQFSERHTIDINAPPERVYVCIRSLNMGQSALIRGLFRLRGMPAAALTLPGLQRLGFTLLGEETNRELVIGLIGRFWAPRGDLVRIDPAMFCAFRRPGYAKTAWNFRIEPLAAQAVQLTTETRIQCLDTPSYGHFRLYWLLISPFSAWTRREMLRIMKRQAERAV